MGSYPLTEAQQTLRTRILNERGHQTQPDPDTPCTNPRGCPRLTPCTDGCTIGLRGGYHMPSRCDATQDVEFDATGLPREKP